MNRRRYARFLLAIFAVGLTLLGISPSQAAPLNTNSNIITVTNNLDNTSNSNGCSLREAIINANTDTATHSDCAPGSGIDTIRFNIGGGGTQTISPISALPTITDPVILDATTQPSCTVPCIVLSGGGAGSSSSGLRISAVMSTVKGFVIQSFKQRGIHLETFGGNIIVSNYIGTDATGTVALGNGNDGIGVLGSPNNRIGGYTKSERNIIANSENGYAGINILFAASTDNVIAGNYIGTDVTGKMAMGNNAGVLMAEGAHNNTVGGTSKPAGNLIRFNQSGVVVGYGTTATTDTGNAIRRNLISSNLDWGIDLGWNTGVAPNDALDADTGPNSLQNFPVVKRSSSTLKTVKGKLLSTPNTTFTIELFKTKTCDASKFGQGAKFIGTATVTTNAAGKGKFNVTTKGFKLGNAITATATDPNGNTSEFSKCKSAK